MPTSGTTPDRQRQGAKMSSFKMTASHFGLVPEAVRRRLFGQKTQMQASGSHFSENVHKMRSGVHEFVRGGEADRLP
ncbi:unnamed protein product, partial [Amoebophrya sp. A25]